MTTRMADLTAVPQTVVGWVGGTLVFDLMVINCPVRFRDARDAFEREFLLAVLRLHGGNISHTAEAIRVSRRHLRTRIVALGIDVRSTRASSPDPERKETE